VEATGKSTDFPAPQVEPQNALRSGATRPNYSRIAAALPVDLKRKLAAVLKSYFAAYGLERVCERLNGRTVAQVLDEFTQPDELVPRPRGRPRDEK